MIATSLFRIAASVMILLTFETLAGDNFTKAYIYSGLLILCFYFYILLINSGLVASYQLGNNIKTALSILLYAKVSKMTSYVIKSN